MIPPHLFYQIIISFLSRAKCGELSEYTDSAHTEVEDLSSRFMNGSNVYDRCGHDTRQLHPSCTTCRRTANLQDKGEKLEGVRGDCLHWRVQGSTSSPTGIGSRRRVV